MKKFNFNLLGYLQSLGKTFMLPVALLSAMGILLGVGSAIDSFVKNTDLQLIKLIASFMINLGGFAFSNIGVLFAIAIPLGLAKSEKGVAAFSGFVGYMIMNLMINFFLIESGNIIEDSLLAKKAGQVMILGINTLDTGILGAIICGSITTFLHNKYHQLKLPTGLSFFEGTRFIPIITSVIMALVGVLIPLIFPYFSKFIVFIGYTIQKSGIFAPFFFGTGERLLLPFGLHHILVALIRFTDAGGSEVINGVNVSGALNIFWAETKAGMFPSTEFTRFLSQGKMPTFLFGLPAAALAIYVTAKEENKLLIKGLLISGVISTVVGGITEPLEFLFLFIAPMLYLFHALMTGFGFMIMGLLEVAIGNTDGNIIDLVIFGIMQGTETKWYLVPIIGSLWFAIYFFTFKWAILKFNIKTPGRGINSNLSNKQADLKSYSAANILLALGNKSNIISIDNCLTRLRLELNDASIINEELLKDSGALGVVKLNNTAVQVIFGPHVQFIKNEILKITDKS